MASWQVSRQSRNSAAEVLWFFCRIHGRSQDFGMGRGKRRMGVRSHIEYLVQTCYILVLILYSTLMRNVAALAVFIRFNDDSR